MAVGQKSRIALRALLLILVILGLADPSSARADYYIAPTGVDTNPGTRAEPFATLERGRDAVRKLKMQGDGKLSGAVTVFLQGGLYLRAASFILGAEDSGTREAPVTYAAIPGELPRLIGAAVLDGKTFARVNGTPDAERFAPASRWRIWKCDLPKFTSSAPGPMMNFDQWGIRVTPSESELFMNGQRMILCRWPNHGDLFTEALDLKRTTKWKAPQEIWVQGSEKWVWNGVTKKVSYPVVWSELPDKGFHFFNVPEELDMAAEYYIDRVRRQLFVLPPASSPKDVKEILLSTLTDPVIVLRNAAHITLRGLSIEAARGDGVLVEGGHHDTIWDCTVANVGRNGIRVEGDHHTLLDCTIRDVGANGVSLSGGDPATGRHSGHLMAGCEVLRPGRRTGRSYAWAISMAGVGHKFSHNEVHDCIRSAVEMRGYHHIFEYNEFYDVVQEVNDQAAIYGGSGPTWGTCGSIYRHNYFHDIHGVPGCLTAAIYADCDATAGFIFGNLFAGMRSAGGNSIGVLANGGRMNQVVGNLFVNIDRPVQIDRGSNKPSESEAWMVRPYLEMVAGNPLFEKYPHSQEPAVVPKEQWDEELTRPKYNVVSGNAFVDCGELLLGKEATEFGTVTGNHEYPSVSAAGLERGALRDYTLGERSTVFRDLPGFSGIPFHDMGRLGRFDPLILEFEDFDMSGGNCIPAMEDGILCGKSAKGAGSGRMEFRGSSGTYDIAIRYKDARNGHAGLALYAAGKALGSWVLDQDDGGWHERVFRDVKLQAGDELRVDCRADGADGACVDWVRAWKLVRNGVKTDCMQSKPTESALPKTGDTLRWRLGAVSHASGFRMDGYFVWCASVIKVAGTYHLFAARWPVTTGFPGGYMQHSEIVRATASSPLGPYTFAEVVIGARPAGLWDSASAHNPAIYEHDGRFYLFYIGCDRGNPLRQLGVAVADRITGPWRRPDQPLDLGLAGDANNPAAVFARDGSVKLIWRTKDLRVFISAARTAAGPYKVVGTNIWPKDRLEDFFFFLRDGQYHVLCEDNGGGVTSHNRWGARLVSPDGASRWSVYEPEPLAYDHTIRWTEGGELTVKRRERPWLLIEDGRATSLLTSVYDGVNTWNQPVPIEPPWPVK